jgi:hypothetical protein
MMQTWSGWKRFADGQDDAVEAPASPGVYEVRHTMTGRVMAFGYSGDVAKSIAELTSNDGVGLWPRLLGRQPLSARLPDLEYRTYAAASRADARTAAQRLLGLRQRAWRRRMELSWAARHPG